MSDSLLIDALNHARFNLLAISSKTQEVFKSNQLLRLSNIRDKIAVDDSISQLLIYHNNINSIFRGIILILNDYSSDVRINELVNNLKLECTSIIAQTCYTIGVIVHQDDHTNQEIPKLIESIKNRLAYLIEYSTVKSADILLKIG